MIKEKSQAEIMMYFYKITLSVPASPSTTLYLCQSWDSNPPSSFSAYSLWRWQGTPST